MSRFDTLNQLEEGTCGYPPHDSRSVLLHRLDAVCELSICKTCTIPATREQEEILGDKDE